MITDQKHRTLRAVQVPSIRVRADHIMAHDLSPLEAIQLDWRQYPVAILASEDD
jgi:hypothetical protein